MKNYILHDATTRAEYKRRWKAIDRAKQKGLNTDLIDAFYSAMIKQGYQRETTTAALYCAARDGLFGFVNKWER